MPSSATWLYVTPANLALAEQYLRRGASGSSISLLARPDATESARELQRQFPNVTGTYGSPGQPPPVESDTTLVFPASPRQHILRFLPGVHLPDWTPYYDEIRSLWLMGFRRFRMSGPGGDTTVEIPWLLDALRDKHRDRRCFVAGNGPSLNQIDMSRLRDEIVLGANRCFLGYPTWGYAFPYWSCVDRLQLEAYGTEYEDNVPPDSIKFFPFEYLPLRRFSNACPINFSYDARTPYRFSDDPAQIWFGFTVVYSLLQIAAIMGCDPIILIGVDHRYPGHAAVATPGTLAKMSERVGDMLRKTSAHAAWMAYKTARKAKRHQEATDQHWEAQRLWTAAETNADTHFTAAYTSESKRFVRPRLDKAAAAFEAAARWATRNGRVILNATPDSALHTFPYVGFDTLF